MPPILPIAAVLAAAQPQPGLEQIARPFFTEHCTKCHCEKKHKGDLRVDNLPIDFDSPKIMGHWEEIMNRINSGDMPPDDVEKRPTSLFANCRARSMRTPSAICSA